MADQPSETGVSVLVHGGGFSGACWDELTPLLRGPVYAVDLPGRGRSPGDLATISVGDFVTSVAGVIVENQLSNVTLVGHSMAGLSLPGIAEMVPARLRRLVFVSCSVPPSGTSLLEILGDLSPAALEIAERVGDELVDHQGVLHPDLATAMFCTDMPESQVASTLSRLVPEALGVLSEPSDLTGLRHPIPRTYVRLLRDASISLEVQDQMIVNLNPVDVVDLDAGHMAMISRPGDLADILNAL
jgi:pimeloyl-ACP methyl ester carboxylesterase